MTPHSAAKISVLFAALSLTGCGIADRLADVGKAPALTPIENPTVQPGYKPVQMPMPKPPEVKYSAGSSWRSGSRTFFKDQRAQLIGDILTVKVTIADKAKFSDTTARDRSATDSSTVGGGLETNLLPKIATGAVVNNSMTSTTKGDGSIDRSETVATSVAAIVTQVLPNGNFVIEGHQEVRVNFEVRELIIAGVIRPEDIASDNTIDSTKIAEERISYGGRGQITDVQQPRYGQQVLDVVLPF